MRATDCNERFGPVTVEGCWLLAISFWLPWHVLRAWGCLHGFGKHVSERPLPREVPYGPGSVNTHRHGNAILSRARQQAVLRSC
jgi:hypothetical protein